MAKGTRTPAQQKAFEKAQATRKANKAARDAEAKAATDKAAEEAEQAKIIEEAEAAKAAETPEPPVATAPVEDPPTEIIKATEGPIENAEIAPTLVAGDDGIKRTYVGGIYQNFVP